MMNRNILAIADVICHKKLGIVSHQPGRIGSDDYYPKGKNKIYVRNINFILHTVSANDCKPSTIKEKEEYWRQNKHVLINENAIKHLPIGNDQI